MFWKLALRPQPALKWRMPHQKVNFVNFAFSSQTLHICLEEEVIFHLTPVEVGLVWCWSQVLVSDCFDWVGLGPPASLHHRLQRCIATINRWTDYRNNHEIIVSDYWLSQKHRKIIGPDGLEK